MKIELTYSKKSDGNIHAIVKVVDSEDYPTGMIFEDSFSEDTKPSEWKDHKINRRTTTSFSIEGTQAYVDSQIEKELKILKDYLTKWRRIPISGDKVVVI